MALDAPRRVARAGRLEATARTQQGHDGRQEEPIKVQQHEHQAGQHVLPPPRCVGGAPSARASRALFLICASAARHSAWTVARPRVEVPGRAMTTRSTPAGKSSGQRRKHSRQRRRTRLRCTAPPTLRLVTMPRRAGAGPGGSADVGAGRAATSNRKCAVVTRRPDRWANTNSACRVSRRLRPRPLLRPPLPSRSPRRCCSSNAGRYFLYTVGTSRSRPLRRRFFSTFWPPRVAMRARKPCVRARRTLWGWYVRFTGGREESTARGAGSEVRDRRFASATIQGRLSRLALITPRLVVGVSPLATTDFTKRRNATSRHTKNLGQIVD